MKKSRRRSGDRSDGRLIRSLPPISKMIPFIMPTRNDAMLYYDEAFEISSANSFINKLRNEGSKGIGFLHFIIAAYVRVISMLPGINRFVAGRRVYAANGIDIVMMVKPNLSVDSSEVAIKVHFLPTDTIYDVYKKMNDAIENVRTSDEKNDTDKLMDSLSKLPRGILRFLLMFIRILDYFGILPGRLLDASPFHGSMIITDLGSLRIRPVFHHIYNFGTLPVFIAFGSKRQAFEINKEGKVESKKYLDMKFTMDERIADGHYFAQFLQGLRYIFLHPDILLTPPSKIVEDIY